MHIQRKFAVAGVLVFGAGLAYAADQTILGNNFLVKNPGTTDKRKIVGKAKESGSANTINGNPVAAGATLTIRADGGSPSVQVFGLPQGTITATGKPAWSGDATKGFKYKDPKGQNGPVKIAQIKKSASGTFSIKAVISGKNGTILVTPPNPGTGGCMLLGLNLGDTYSVSFEPGTGAQLTNKDGILFKAKKPTSEGTCLVTTTTTTTTTSSTTTSTTLYGSPSRAFFDHVASLLD